MPAGRERRGHSVVLGGASEGGVAGRHPTAKCPAQRPNLRPRNRAGTSNQVVGVSPRADLENTSWGVRTRTLTNRVRVSSFHFVSAYAAKVYENTFKPTKIPVMQEKHGKIYFAGVATPGGDYRKTLRSVRKFPKIPSCFFGTNSD